MGVKVYGAATTTSTSRVLTCLHEKGVDQFQLCPINLYLGEQNLPHFLSKNPFGQIPVLEDGDLILFESRAIAKYIAIKHKDVGTDLLRHNNLKESALVEVWLEVESQQYNPAISPVVYERVIRPLYGETPDEKVIADHAEKLGKVLDVYEERLSRSKYLAGEFYSLADLSHLPYTYYLMKTPEATLINSRPNVKTWWEDISSRLAFQKVAAEMTAA